MFLAKASNLCLSLQHHIENDQRSELALKSEELKNEQESLLHGDLGDLLQDDNWFRAATYDRKAFRTLHDQQQRAADIIQRLPSPEIMNELVHNFFNEVHWFYIMPDKDLFTEDLSRWLAAYPHGSKIETFTKDMEAFPAVLFQILALSLHFTTPDCTAADTLAVRDPTSSDRLSRYFSDAGMELLDTLGRHNPSIMFVQADFLRTAWLKNCGRSTEAWQTLGTAIRQAQELRLHRKGKLKKYSTDEEEQRAMWYDEYKSRLWAGLFAWDSLLAWVQGRSRRIHINDCDVPPPRDRCSATKMTRFISQNKNDSKDRDPVITGLLFHYTISQLVHNMRDAHVERDLGEKYDSVRQLHQEVLSLLENLPDILSPYKTNTSWDAAMPNLPRQREQLFSLTHHTLMGLHRAQIANHVESRTEFTNSAMLCLESQERFFRMTPRHQYRLYGLMYYTIDAAIMLSAITVTYPPEDPVLRRRTSDNLQKAIERLELMKDCNPTATSGLKLINRCYQKVRDVLDTNLPWQGDLVSEIPRSIGALSTPNAEHGDTLTKSGAPPDMAQDIQGADRNELISTALFDELSNETFDDAFLLDQLNPLPALPFGESTIFDWESLFHDANS
ncbi:hypothetical protein NA57DRAFT_70411 [Rhizodiscina lignyota]|uniref:Xylanolytic transcriptional activator regulatory domain-containing protein n=1 Tax=Rhizodiscina lignyota TaxID=1504668 RepID=A0A9P4IR05_9PEZI|nr:hypothetical protein NA57DRAFT_70411 [Rhizodiscina lignyota]